MKRIISLLAIIPFITFAQSKKTSSKKPTLIESITSDTSKGKFNQVLFSYDQSNRVISIINKVIYINAGSTEKNKQTEKIIKKQIFEYADTANQPFSRKITSYKPYPKYSTDKEKWIAEEIEQQYFLYEQGQRVGDSSIYFKNWREELDWDSKRTEPQKRIGKLEQTNSRIYHKIDVAKPYSPPNYYANEFKLSSQLNISDDASSYRYGNRGNDATYYNFSTFDSSMNPLKQLNIASALVNEKISSEFGGQYGRTDINWYFFNQNNYIDYSVTTDEQTQHFKYIFKFNYTYNKFKQPTTAKAQVKQVFNNGGKLVQEYQQRFTFRYKK
jgi:hypothetical protein